MAYYRLYQLHGPRNEVENFHEFEAPDDASAIRVGEERRGINPMELWQSHRKVMRWEGLLSASSAAPPRSSRS